MNYTNLSVEELIKLSRNKNESATEELLNRYKYVPASIARSYFLVGGAEEDLLQEGMIGLYRAIITYDESKGNFKTFVYTCVKNNIISLVKKSKAKKNEPLNEYISLSGFVDGDSDKSLFIQDGKFGPEDLFIYKESETELEDKLKEKLSIIEYQIFDLYIKGATYAQISEKVGKSQKSVDNSLQRIKKKIINIIAVNK